MWYMILLSFAIGNGTIDQFGPFNFQETCLEARAKITNHRIAKSRVERGNLIIECVKK